MDQLPQGARNRPAPVAFVTYLRPYSSLEFVSMLVKLGFTTTERPFDDRAHRIANRLKPDVVVLVLDPGVRASEDVVREFVHNTTALLIVLAPKRDPAGFSKLLAAGADLCVREDEQPQLLAAQISAAWRRVAFASDSAVELIQLGPLRIDVRRCEVNWRDALVSLSPTEFRVLVCLAERAGQVISAHEIMRRVQDYSPSEREAKEAAKVYISRIRAKFALDPDGERLISTIRGFGYLLDVMEPERRPMPDAAVATEPHEGRPW